MIKELQAFLLQFSPWGQMIQAGMPQPLNLQRLDCATCGRVAGWQRDGGGLTVVKCRDCHKDDAGRLQSLNQVCDTEPIR